MHFGGFVVLGPEAGLRHALLPYEGCSQPPQHGRWPQAMARIPEVT